MIFPTIMLQWWGGHRAVQSQHYFPSSHCHLTSLPFHRNSLTLAVVCLSMYRHSIAKICNTNSTLPFNYLLLLPDGWTANVLWWCCQHYGKTTSCCREKTLRSNYEWWWPYWHNLRIYQFLLFAAHSSSAFIQCERGFIYKIYHSDNRLNHFKII